MWLSPQSVLLKGKAMIEDAGAVSRASRDGLFEHVFTRYYGVNVGFSYWHGRRDEEVDIVADVNGGWCRLR